ncbi:MAG: TonB-dependent receptor [candidate division Zixibacteria bacterium]|nr:TonB-dependent receptor [candidate division Zixibacteria bacterium]
MLKTSSLFNGGVMSNKKLLFIGAVMVFAVLLSASWLGAATLKGYVRDANTGEVLYGASVYVKGTQYGAPTDRTGRYSIPNLPPGEYTVVYSYLGYDEMSKTVDLGSGEAVIENITLEPRLVEMEPVFVVGMRQGQTKALNQQRTAENIKNVVAADLIGRFPDPNSAEALQRIPSLSIQRDQGEGRYVLIRGTEARLNSVMINGERIPSPEGDIRSVALDVIPADVLSSIEVNKAITPDMDADAIGGSINLVTKNAFDFEGPVLKASLGSGYNDIVGDAIYQNSLTYGNRFGEGKKFGLLVNASYYKTNRGSDNNEMSWADTGDIEDIEEDNGIDIPSGANVINELDLRDYVLTRERLGLSANFDYRPDENNSFYIRSLYNRFGDSEHRRRMVVVFDDASSYSNVGNSSGNLTEATFERELKDRYEVQRIYSISGGGRHLFSNMELDYNLSFSHAEEEEPDRRDINFVQEGVDLNYNTSDTDLPKFEVTGGGDPYDPSLYEFDELVLSDNLTTDEDITGEVNFQLPYKFNEIPGKLKLGVKYRGKTKDRENDIRVYDGYAGDLSLADVAGGFEDKDFMGNEYEIGLSPDPNNVKSMVDNNLSDFELNEDDTREESDGESYEASEDVFAGYLMTQVYFGKLMVLPGVRVEMTQLDYTGNEIVFNEDGDYEATNEVQADDDYMNILPMVHFKYELNKRTNLRLAFTNTIARPNYFDLVPYRYVNREDEELERGNSELDPTTAYNIDFMVEHYLPSLGLVSAGVFYKQLNDYIYMRVSDGTGAFDGYEVLQPVNGESATLYGFEVAWQQQLTFLSGFLNGFGVYANYTYTDSEAEFPDREGEKATLPGQAEHVANFALSYEKYGFSGRLAVNYHGKYIEEVGGSPEDDVYYDNHLQLDVSASQRIVPGLYGFVEVLNLTDSPLRYYQGSEDRPIQREFYSYWAHVGLKFEL